jgi:BirA family biotin operon repressor/biotin-[acetyl-CoA-carboxylase] ligase
MNAPFRDQLSGLPIGPVRYFETIGSTNTYAAAWAAEGAPDLSLVVADEQTAGKGRGGRSWHTPPGSALAFSLLLAPPGSSTPPGRYTALGALAVQETLSGNYGLPSAIKWPNDVLVAGAKVCGVLVEAGWQGNRPGNILLGIGINVRPAALPPAQHLQFPATCVEAALGRPVDRWALLRQVLEALLQWRDRMDSTTFVPAWERRLAFLGQPVQVGETAGRLVGLTPEGHLRLETGQGERIFPMGEISLRPSA